MRKDDVVKERKEIVKLTEKQGKAWKAYRDGQIQALVNDALSRNMNDDTIKRLVPLAIARQIDQMHNSADRKISAYEAGTQLSLDELFSDAGRTTAKAVAYERAMDLFLDAAAVDRAKAKAIMATARKVDTITAWEKAIVEFEEILG